MLDSQIGITLLAMLRTPQPPSPETVLAVLTNDLVERGGDDFALVLDDYHVIITDPILGLGIGDIPFEFAQMGLPFLSTRERQEALEETIQVVRGVWGTVPYTYKGKYTQVQHAHLPFGPVQQPHVPVLIHPLQQRCLDAYS